MGTDFDFDFNPDIDQPYQPARPSPWKWVAIAGGIVAVIGVLVGAYFLLAPRILGLSPEATVRAYYEALNEEDYEKAREYLDASVASTALGMADFVEQQIKSLAKEWFGAEVNLLVEFQDLKFTRVEKKGDNAIVNVSGKVKLSEVLTKLNFTISYKLDHTLKKTDGKWLILP